MNWENFRVDFVLTPTAVFLLPKNRGSSIRIPYRVIDEVSVRDVPIWIWWPLGEPGINPDLLVIQSDQVNCWQGCVFRFDNVQLGHTAVSIINRQRAQIDPFGRIDGPRTFGLVVSSRNPLVDWRPAPAFLQNRHPELLAELNTLYETVTKELAPAFAGVLQDSLNREPLSDSPDGWQVRPISNYDGEAFAGNSTSRENTAALLTAQPDLDSLLLASFSSVALQERISARYEPSVLMTLTVNLVFRDLVPPAPGQVSQVKVEKIYSVDDWLKSGRELINRALLDLADQTRHSISSALLTTTSASD